MSLRQIPTSEESSETYIFRKLITEAILIRNQYFGQVFQKLWQCKCNLTTFDMGALQIWSYHVTQDNNLSLLY